MFITIFTHVSGWRKSTSSTENCFNFSKCSINRYLCLYDDILLNYTGIKLEKRADKLKEVERRSLRIVQVKEKPEDDNL